MKKISFPLLGLAFATMLINFSCEKKKSKKTVTCYHSIYYMNFGFAFVGFEQQEVDTLLLKKYEQGSNFNTLIGIDTLVVDTFFVKGDTLYKSKTGTPLVDYFFSLDNKADYVLALPSIATSIKITEVKEGASSGFVEVEERCSPGSGQARFRPYLANFANDYGYQVGVSYGFSATPADNVAYIKK